MKHCSILNGESEKPIIFLLHGLFANRNAQNRLSNALNQEGYTIISCDARGHGDNEGFVYEWDKTIKEYEKRIEECPSQDIIIIGHSMGATQAITLSKCPKVKQVFSISPLFDAGPITNLNLLHKMFIAFNVIPHFKKYSTSEEQTIEKHEEFLQEKDEIKAQLKDLTDALNQIGLYFEYLDEKKPLEKAREKIYEFLDNFKEKEVVHNFIEFSKEMKEKIEEKAWTKKLHEIQNHLNNSLKIKQYFLKMKETIDDIVENRFLVKDYLPVNIELNEIECEKLHIIGSKVDLLIPFNHFERIIEKYHIPEDRYLVIKMVHGYTDDINKTKNYILSKILQ